MSNLVAWARLGRRLSGRGNLRLSKFLTRLGLVCTVFLLVLASTVLMPGSLTWGTVAPAQAQVPLVLRRVDPVAIATQIYAQLPNLPLENNYRLQGGNTAASNDTFISRFIRYHLYVKDRLGNFRRDWKFSVADYLDAFEPMVAEDFPSADLLAVNPMTGDRLAMQNLTRTQRHQLVQSLFEIFTGSPPVPASVSSPQKPAAPDLETNLGPT